MKINLKLIKVSCLFLMLGLSLHTYGQRRHHINQTFTKNGKFKENSVVYLIKDTTESMDYYSAMKESNLR